MINRNSEKKKNTWVRQIKVGLFKRGEREERKYFSLTALGDI